MLDLRSAYWTTMYDKHLFGHSMLRASLIDEHLASVPPGKVVTAATPPARVDLLVAIIQQGRFVEFLGTDRVLFPEERLEDGATLPPLLFFHGLDDGEVPLSGAEKFAEMLKTPLHFVKRPGGHGFDIGASLTEEWLEEGIEFVRREWIS